MKRNIILYACGLSMLLLLLAGAVLPATAFAASKHSNGAGYALLDACSSHPSDATCDGVSPDQTNCPADAITLNITNIISGTTVVGTIALRYSPACQSAWAHTTSSIGNANLYAQIRRSDGLLYSKSGVGTGIRSPMVFVNFQAVRACGTINGAAACAPNS